MSRFDLQSEPVVTLNQPVPIVEKHPTQALFSKSYFRFRKKHWGSNILGFLTISKPDIIFLILIRSTEKREAVAVVRKGYSLSFLMNRNKLYTNVWAFSSWSRMSTCFTSTPWIEIAILGSKYKTFFGYECVYHMRLVVLANVTEQ